MFSLPPELQAQLEHWLGVAFHDPALLCQAVTHASAVNEARGAHRSASNERLEFLGDATLSIVMAMLLYRALPEASEGTLTRLRATVVRRESVATVARNLGLGTFLILGRGEEVSGGRERDTTLANALEAVIGAVVLDRGFDAAHELIARLYRDQLASAIQDTSGGLDPKSALQERFQADRKPVPTYRTDEAPRAANGATRFTVDVLDEGRLLATGRGATRKAAEQDAARRVLAVMDSVAQPDGSSAPDMGTLSDRVSAPDGDR